MNEHFYDNFLFSLYSCVMQAFCLETVEIELILPFPFQLKMFKNIDML